MEPRIAKLEASMDHVLSDVTGLKADVPQVMTDIGAIKERLARLEVKVSHLPGKGFIVGTTLTTLVLITALLAYQDKIRTIISP